MVRVKPFFSECLKLYCINHLHHITTKLQSRIVGRKLFQRMRIQESRNIISMKYIQSSICANDASTYSENSDQTLIFNNIGLLGSRDEKRFYLNQKILKVPSSIVVVINPTKDHDIPSGTTTPV